MNGILIEVTHGHFVTPNAVEDFRYTNAVGRKTGISVYSAVSVCFIIKSSGKLAPKWGKRRGASAHGWTNNLKSEGNVS